MDVETLQGKVPLVERERTGMGMQRRLTDAELEARQRQPESYVTVRTPLFKALDGHCQECGAVCRGEVCKSCNHVQKNLLEGYPGQPGAPQAPEPLAPSEVVKSADPLVARATALQAGLAAAVVKGLGKEGTRGGKVIGHTRSGKPIYAASHPHYRHRTTGHTAFSAGRHRGDGEANPAAAAAYAREHPEFAGYSREDHEDARDAHLAEGNAAVERGDYHPDQAEAAGFHSRAARGLQAPEKPDPKKPGPKKPGPDQPGTGKPEGPVRKGLDPLAARAVALQAGLAAAASKRGKPSG